MVDVKLIQPSTTDIAQGNAWTSVENKYGRPSGNCVLIDETRKRLVDDIAAYTKNVNYDRTYLDALNSKKSAFDYAFETMMCRDKIEKSRQETAAIEVTLAAIKQEKEVLKKDEKQQNIYIGVGIVGILAAMYLILK